MYHMPLYCHVIPEMLLPNSVILFHIPISRGIMDSFKISHRLEIFALSSFLGMLALSVAFIMESLFGNSIWIIDSRGSMGNGVILLHTFLLVFAFTSLGFTLYLIIIPLRLTSNGSDKQIHILELQRYLAQLSVGRGEIDSAKISGNDQHSLTEITSEEFLDRQFAYSSQTITTDGAEPVVTGSLETVYENLDIPTRKINNSTIRGMLMEDNVHNDSNGQHGSASETLKLSNTSLASEVSKNSKNTRDQSENKSNANGNVGLAGLSRGTRLQFAAVLDEFWGLIFDYHGNFTEEAKAKSVDIVLGLVSELASMPASENVVDESSWKISPEARRGIVCPTSSANEAPLGYYIHFVPKQPKSLFSEPMSLNLDPEAIWANPFSRSFTAFMDAENHRDNGVMNILGTDQNLYSYGEQKATVLRSLHFCILKLLKLEGSNLLFNMNGGCDEELIDRIAATERILHKDHIDKVDRMGEAKYLANFPFLFPDCGVSCIWKPSLIVSFGVWCIRLILELLLVEKRPELWGKYTYVLNRLQGILKPAFCKPRSPVIPCKCLDQFQQETGSSGGIQNTTTSIISEIIKNVESVISLRKGKAGTRQGNIAYPQGRKNVASVLKRYRRHLSNKFSSENVGDSASFMKDMQ